MSNRRVGREGAAKHLLCVFLLAAGFGLFARPAAAGTITVAWDLMDAANVSGPSMRFFALLMRDSAARGCTVLSSRPSSRSDCFMTDIWSVVS